jgi:hypothetical protein
LANNESKGRVVLIMHRKKSVSLWLLIFMLACLIQPGAYPALAADNQALANLSLDPSVKITSSSECKGCQPSGLRTYVADGDRGTAWTYLSADMEDHKVWVELELAQNADIQEIRLQDAAMGQIETYTISFRDALGMALTDSLNETNGVVQEDGSIQHLIQINAKYVKLEITKQASVSKRFYPVSEIEIFGKYSEGSTEQGIKDFYFLDHRNHRVEPSGDIKMDRGSSIQLTPVVEMYDGRTPKLEEITITYESSKPEIAEADPQGRIVGHIRGVTVLKAVARYGSQALLAQAFVVVEDKAAHFADTTLIHEQLTTEIGKPAILEPAHTSSPQVQIEPHVNLNMGLSLIRNDQEIIYSIPAQSIAAKEAKVFDLPHGLTEGRYEVRLELESSEGIQLYDSLYFTIQNSAAILAQGQSQIAYLNEEGRMIYVPDYKGNHILDYSNSGYMGGGVPLPDVRAAIVIHPGEGDDSGRIQAAIDYVSSLPVGSNGFRGAVVLGKGQFELSKTLYMNTSGIVLRGQGDSDEGTVLHATGKGKRAILEVGKNAAAPIIDESSAVTITDLYVPVGSRTFHVHDASGFRVGDTVMVRRHADTTWIHDIHMDQIVEREDTQQWSPFVQNMDRVITQIEGNQITIDAPIVNAIEMMYGEGKLLKYSDVGRLEQIGIENLKVTVEFDPSIVSTHSDGTTYLSDEDKADTFVNLNKVKNAWVRNIAGHHLAYQLVYTGRESKWITIQDSSMENMISQITGSRRYPFHYSGQLALGQRLKIDGARHAFIVNSRVIGPNVFLDSRSTNDYNRSEPHHRWSVGGLFDQVEGDMNAIDRANYGTGHGWAGANYVFWNSKGSITVQKPPTAQNYAIGFVGVKKPADFGPEGKDPERFREDGYWDPGADLRSHVRPISLYKQQLSERLGEEAVHNLRETPVGGAELDTPAPVTAAVLSPAEPGGLREWYTDEVLLTLSVTDTSGSGVTTEYRLGKEGPWQPYVQPVTFREDGIYRIEYRSKNALGGEEELQTLQFSIDKAAPIISLSSPGQYSVVDEVGPSSWIADISDVLSGVDELSITVQLDGAAVELEQPIELFRLSPGTHKVIVSASDLAGNQGSAILEFTIHASKESLRSLVEEFQLKGWISNQGIENSLIKKLEADQLGSFINELKAQADKHVSKEAADILISYSLWLQGQMK